MNEKELIEEYRKRLVNAKITLQEKIEIIYGDTEEYSRLRGKIQGVSLALSYLDEMLRDVEK